MAEEDLFFGKNRHLFGGIEPANMTKFQAVSSYEPTEQIDRVKIVCELPGDTVIDGQTLCSIAGAVIRKSADGYPQTEFDGTLVSDISADTVLYDTNVVLGTTYYYAAFPYSKQGVYNRNAANRWNCTVARYEYLFGYDLAKSTSTPNTRVTYPADVDNANYTPAAMNFTNSLFNYGGWPSVAGSKFMPKPCMLKYDGTVDYYLNPDDYTKKADGVTASDVANTSYGGNAMMEWPKIYTKRWEEDGVYHFRCSDIPFDDGWDCFSNYDRNNNQIDHFYTPIYFGSSVSSKMRSISGQANYVSGTAAQEITLATANGSDWYTEVLADRLLIQDLLVMMAKTTATQEAYGYGRCASGNTAAIGQGTMNTRGLFWGEDDRTSGVKVFGMENWWGNLWRRTAGWINANGTQKVKITRGTHDGSVATDYNQDGTGYLSVAGATPAGTSGGYISECKTEAYGRILFQASGASNTNECDGLWFYNEQVDYAIVGGAWTDALLVGAFCAYLYLAASTANTHAGAALSCKPLAL